MKEAVILFVFLACRRVCMNPNHSRSKELESRYHRYRWTKEKQRKQVVRILRGNEMYQVPQRKERV